MSSTFLIEEWGFCCLVRTNVTLMSLIAGWPCPLYEAKAAAGAIISLYEVSKTVAPIIIHTPDFFCQLPASITLYRPSPL
jgi:hypothetical protein